METFLAAGAKRRTKSRTGTKMEMATSPHRIQLRAVTQASERAKKREKKTRASFAHLTAKSVREGFLILVRQLLRVVVFLVGAWWRDENRQKRNAHTHTHTHTHTSQMALNILAGVLSTTQRKASMLSPPCVKSLSRREVRCSMFLRWGKGEQGRRKKAHVQRSAKRNE